MKFYNILNVLPYYKVYVTFYLESKTKLTPFICDNTILHTLEAMIQNNKLCKL